MQFGVSQVKIAPLIVCDLAFDWTRLLHLFPIVDTVKLTQEELDSFAPSDNGIRFNRLNCGRIQKARTQCE